MQFNVNGFMLSVQKAAGIAYSDSLRFGRFRDRIPMGRDFPCPFRPAMWPIQPIVQRDHPPLLASRLRMGGSDTSFCHICLHFHIMVWHLPSTFYVKGGVVLVSQITTKNCQIHSKVMLLLYQPTICRWQQWSVLIQDVSRVDTAVCLGY